LLPVSRYRFVAAASYWLNPLSITFSAYHGNTDSAVGFFSFFPFGAWRGTN
jgi:hypothetical protein